MGSWVGGGRRDGRFDGGLGFADGAELVGAGGEAEAEEKEEAEQEAPLLEGQHGGARGGGRGGGAVPPEEPEWVGDAHRCGG